MRATLGMLGACLLLLAACGGDDGKPPSGSVDPAASTLTITADPDGDGPEAPRTERLRCPQARGSSACRALARVPPSAWRPVPRDRVCTEIFGGPQTATINGRHDGETINARFLRSNGCEIARWDDVAPLIALTGVRAR